MNSAWILKRTATIGLIVAVLTIGSTLIQPAATASASVLPDAHVGAPDVGYPSMGPWRGCSGGTCEQATLPDSHVGAPDVGYPYGGCGSGCGGMVVVTPHPSGDGGYPCPGSACDAMDVISPVPSGDVGYPCQSGCWINSQPVSSPTEPDAIIA